MKCLCLAYYDEKAFDAASATELEAIGRACRARDEALCATARLVAQAHRVDASSRAAERVARLGRRGASARAV
ncbi:MAG: hypothetical protein HXY24_19280 [Rubrivivax sp.]|nr:hypothetical protein [Rubrivivax sp.]